MTKETRTQLCKLLKQLADSMAAQEKLVMQIHDVVEKAVPSKETAAKEDPQLDRIESLLKELLEKKNESWKPFKLPPINPLTPYYDQPRPWSMPEITCKSNTDFPVWPETNEDGYARMSKDSDVVIHDGVYRSKKGNKQ